MKLPAGGISSSSKAEVRQILGGTRPRSRADSLPLNPNVISAVARVPAAADHADPPHVFDPEPEKRRGKAWNGMGTDVYCVELRRVMSLQEAAELTGAKSQSIKNACSPCQVKRGVGCGGYHFRWAQQVVKVAAVGEEHEEQD